MRLTRRGWGTAFVGLFILTLGLLLRRPLLLVGGALVGAWLMGAAALYVRQLQDLLGGFQIEHRTERDRVVAGRDLAVTLSARLPSSSPLAVTVESQPPVSTASLDGASDLTIAIGNVQAGTTYLATWPHAGTVAFDPPAVTATERLGLFRTRFEAGPSPTVTVAPPAPREIHVGVGGEPLAAGYGEHGSGRTGAGLEPAELREYVPGDAATRIDWKTTARLAEPYVREYEIQTDRRLVLIIDHRDATGRGPAGETVLDYLREVALAYVASARALDDPLGCYTVGAEGLTGQWRPAADRDQYARIDRHLGALTPTDEPSESTPIERTTAADARTLASRLDDDDSLFANTLRPYFDAAEGYIQRIEDEPLYRTVRQARRTLQGPLWTVLLTDDSDPAAVRQAVSVARRGEGRVIVYLAPSALYEPGGLGNLDAAYDRYVEFEEFRRELARPNNVAVYEVAPGDRLEAVLTAGRGRRQRSAASGGG